jgi:oxygen-independent coproporphyrinogen-3 oxidase
MLRLRTADGLDLRDVATFYGADVAQRALQALRPHLRAGRAAMVGAVPMHQDVQDTQLPVIRLSDPDGFLLSNDIISDVFAALGDLNGDKGSAAAEVASTAAPV